MLNSVVLAGNLGNDPDIHFNSEGEPIASFNLAFRASKQKTGWIRVTVFSKLAEIVEKHLHKAPRSLSLESSIIPNGRPMKGSNAVQYR